MGLLDKMKQEAAKSGASKGKFMYFRPDEKKRVRFLQELDDGLEIPFHDNYEKGVNVPCQEVFGKDCPYCEDEDLRTRSQFAFSVYDYDAKEVKILMQAVNQCSAIPALVNMAETYGTITDRDYVISVSGKMQNKTFSVVPMDKVKFRNEKAKAYSEKSILKMLDKAFPCDATEDNDDDEDDDDDTSKKRTQKSADKKNTHKPEPEDDNDDDYDNEDLSEDDEDDADAADYSEMSAKELYNLCKEREIKVAPRKPAKYYINQLEEWDAAQEDWGEEEDDDDDWEDD